MKGCVDLHLDLTSTQAKLGELRNKLTAMRL